MQIDMITLTLPGGETFELPSEIDQHGTRRYVRNAVIDAAFDCGLIDLNQIAVMCGKQSIPLKDRIEFWSMLGYSVDGMCDLSFMYPVRVVTPEWIKEAQTDEDDE